MNKTARIHIRCSVKDKQKITHLAKETNKTISNYLIEGVSMCGLVGEMKSGEKGECVMPKYHKGAHYMRAIQ